MFCEKCGAKLPDDSVFCSNCGAKINIPGNDDNSNIIDNYSDNNINNNDNYNNNINNSGNYNNNINNSGNYNNNINNGGNYNLNKNSNRKNNIIIAVIIGAAAVAVAVILLMMFVFPKDNSEKKSDDYFEDFISEISEIDSESNFDGLFQHDNSDDKKSPDKTPEKAEDDMNAAKPQPTKKPIPTPSMTKDSSDKETVIASKSNAENNNVKNEVDIENNGYGTAFIYNTDYVTLRSEAKTSGKEIMKLHSGDIVNIKSIDESGYFKVEYNGTEGYLVPSYLSLYDDALYSIESSKTYTVITDYVTLRDIPSTSGTAIDTIYTGAALEYFSDAQDGFCLVRYNGRFGYVLKAYKGETLLR